MTTVNIKFNYKGNFATFMRLVGRRWDDRSWGLSYELKSGRNSDTLIRGIYPSDEGVVQMEWDGDAQDIAEAMSNLWQHLLYEQEDEALLLEICGRSYTHWWCDLEGVGCEDPEEATEVDMLKLILSAS